MWAGASRPRLGGGTHPARSEGAAVSIAAARDRLTRAASPAFLTPFDAVTEAGPRFWLEPSQTTRLTIPCQGNWRDFPSGRRAVELLTDRTHKAGATDAGPRDRGKKLLTDAENLLSALLTIGKTPGRVVRHLEDGIAIEFIRLQHSDFLEENVTGG